jgi:hypothetical protein
MVLFYYSLCLHQKTPKAAEAALDVLFALWRDGINFPE